jgi:NADH-quinone oxidoreductase subunit C
MSASSALETLRQALPGAAIEEAPSIDMPAIYVGRGDLVDVCRRLRDNPALQFALLADVTAADYLPEAPRFEIVYHLACLGESYLAPGAASPATARRLRLKIRVPGDDAWVPSVTSVWAGAGWLEREVFDLFGIGFEGHPDLRRILMPDDWQGHPLRRDSSVQIRKETAAWQPIELSPEEFAEGMRALRRGASRAARSDHDRG